MKRMMIAFALFTGMFLFLNGVCMAKECSKMEEWLGKCDTEEAPAPETAPVTPAHTFPFPSTNTTTPTVPTPLPGPIPDPTPIPVGRIYYVPAIYMDSHGMPHNTWIGFTRDKKLCTEE
jgi:hypothetical protein